jgi:hypothetical protein
MNIKSSLLLNGAIPRGNRALFYSLQNDIILACAFLGKLIGTQSASGASCDCCNIASKAA